MTDSDVDNLIGKMKDVFPTREDLLAFQQETRNRFDAIEKDLKSVVRIYNLDEEMAALYVRLQRLETKVGIQQGT